MPGFSKLLSSLIPPPSWRLPVLLLLSVFAGMGAYAFYLSKAWSYLSDDPKVCVNCHIMSPEYATWSHSSHRQVSCNDCHVPHTSALAKYAFKAYDGMRHSTMFTLRLEPQVIRIREPGRAVVQENCKRCHAFRNERVSTLRVTGKNAPHGEGRLCVECHRYTPHGRVHSLASVPDAQVPLPTTPVPSWLRASTKESPR
ncbi:MAG: cytochrome c nitrite reductase small subunit [Spirochaetes bacterium]|nr:cytochrome c nitrite reductase small subunit [Spirochaetota bacterium]